MNSGDRDTLLVNFAGQLGEMKGLMISANEKLDNAKEARASMHTQLDNHEERLIIQEQFTKTTKLAVRSAWAAVIASGGALAAWIKTLV